MKIYLKSQLISTLIVILICYKGVICDSHYKLIKFDLKTEAACLDGSPYGIYFSPGSSQGARNILISFWGGGWWAGRDRDSILSDCVERSKTSLGSSTNWDLEVNNTWGFMGGEKSKNPNFYNWHRFDLPYCDGSGHQGHVTDHIHHKGTNLYFRGGKNVLSALDYIFTNINLLEIDRIVITGCSAGGLATFTWSQYISEKAKAVNPSIKVFGLPDSGYFIDHLNINTQDYDYRLKIQNLYQIVNKEIYPTIPDCVSDHKGEEYKCLFAANMLPYLNIPFLMIQPGYDSWQLHNILGMDCSDSFSLTTCDDKHKLMAHEYKDYQNKLLTDTLKTKTNLSIWNVSCLIHCFGDDTQNSSDWSVPENSGNTINKVVSEFLSSDGMKIEFMDNVNWPINNRCSNLNKNKRKKKTEF